MTSQNNNTSMKFLNSYNSFLNEAAIDFLKPKSKEKILKDIEGLDNIDKYTKGIDYNLPWLVKDMIDEGIEPTIEDLLVTIMHGYIEITKILLNEKSLDPSGDDNQALLQAVVHNQIEIVELLLKDKRVDPTGGGFNFPIREASREGHLEILKLLLNDKRVRNNMLKTDKRYYENQLKGLNESVTNYLKPRPKDDILKSIKSLSDKEKMIKACEYGITWLVQELLDNGFDPSYNHNISIYTASNYGHTNIVKILIDDKRVDPSDSDNGSIRIAYHAGNKEIVKLLLRDKRVRMKVKDPNRLKRYYLYAYTNKLDD